MSGRPTATVVIPTKDRPAELSACLRSLAEQDYPRGLWRVAVVNDGGRDPSPAIDATGSPEFPLRVLHAPPRGPAAARNLGATETDSDLLVFLDDDCRAEPAWLRELADGIASSPYHACQGRTLNLHPERWPARAYQYFMEFYRDYQRLAANDLYLVMSNNAVYRRTAFAELGGFCEEFPRPGAEDLELSHRMTARGFRQGYLPAAVVRHAHCATAARFVRQQFQYGRGFARMKAVLRRKGIPLQVGQRRRPQFHLELLRSMLRENPGLRECLLIWAGIFAHAAGSRWETMRQSVGRWEPPGDAA